jgi:hypothetical protein
VTVENPQPRCCDPRRRGSDSTEQGSGERGGRFVSWPPTDGLLLFVACGRGNNNTASRPQKKKTALQISTVDRHSRASGAGVAAFVSSSNTSTCRDGTVCVVCQRELSFARCVRSAGTGRAKPCMQAASSCARRSRVHKWRRRDGAVDSYGRRLCTLLYDWLLTVPLANGKVALRSSCPRCGEDPPHSTTSCSCH